MSGKTDQINPNNPQPEPEKKEPEKKIKFSYFEPIFGILFAIIATVIFLVFPQIIGVFFLGFGDHHIPAFDANVIRGLWVLIPAIIWAILRIAVEIAYLVERRYTKRLALITVIGDVLAVICTLIMFIPYRIVNVEYIDFVHRYFTNVSAWFTEILVRPNLIIMIIIIIYMILDSVNAVIKGNKAKEKKEDEEEDDPEAGKMVSKAIDINADAEDANAVADSVVDSATDTAAEVTSDQ